MAAAQLLLFLAYQSGDTGSPGLPGAGATITVSFAKRHLDTSYANCNCSVL